MELNSLAEKKCTLEKMNLFMLTSPDRLKKMYVFAIFRTFHLYFEHRVRKPVFTHSDWKEERVLETCVSIVFSYPVQNLHFVTSSESSGVVKVIKNDLLVRWLVVYFHVIKSATLSWVSKMNNSLLKSHVLLINVFNMEHCLWYIVHLRVVFCWNCKKLACKMV